MTGRIERRLIVRNSPERPPSTLQDRLRQLQERLNEFDALRNASTREYAASNARVLDAAREVVRAGLPIILRGSGEKDPAASSGE